MYQMPQRLGKLSVLRLKAATRYHLMYGVPAHVSLQIVHSWSCKRVKAFVNMPRYTAIVPA